MTEELEKALPSLTVKLGGKDRVLVCSMFVLWQFQNSTGKNPFQLNVKDMSPEDMVTLLWAAVSQDEPEITKAEVAKMMGAVHLKDVGKLIAKLFSVAAPSKDPEAPSSESPDSKKN